MVLSDVGEPPEARRRVKGGLLQRRPKPAQTNLIFWLIGPVDKLASGRLGNRLIPKSRRPLRIEVSDQCSVAIRKLELKVVPDPAPTDERQHAGKVTLIGPGR